MSLMDDERQRLNEQMAQNEHKLHYYTELCNTYDGLVQELVKKESVLKNADGLDLLRTRLERIQMNNNLFNARILLEKHAQRCGAEETEASKREKEVAANFDNLYWKVKTALNEAKVRGPLPKKLADMDDLLENSKKPSELSSVDRGIIYGLLKLVNIQ